MEILAVSCVHNDIENMFRLVDAASKLDFDVVVFPGDFTDLNLPRGFTRVDVVKIIVSELETLGKPLVCVPGSWDKDTDVYLNKKGISVHGRGKIINGIGFYGYGGARTPFNTLFEPADGEIELGLMKAYDEVKGAEAKVQVTHMPPARTAVDRIYSGAHVGSEAVRKFIELKKPEVSISAHIHEAKGIGDLGQTKLVNPGRLPEGSAALISVRKGHAEARMVGLISEVEVPVGENAVRNGQI
jgi:Icc-related predicted phosphoesterase